MRFPDPIGLKHKISSSIVLSASCQSQGKRQRQEDAVYHNSEDIFVIADGIGGLSHGDIAAQTVVDAAVWAVKIGKQRPSHWKDKKLLVQKIIRSVNLTVYNKRIEKEIGVDLGSTLSLLFFGEQKYYICHVGDSRIYVYRNNKLHHLTPLDRDNRGYLTKAVGITKETPEPFFYSATLLKHDVFLLVTDGVGDVVPHNELEMLLSSMEHKQEGLQTTAREIVVLAENYNGSDNMTACIVQHGIYS